MVVTAKKGRDEAKKPEISMHPLNRREGAPRRRPMSQPWTGNWIHRLFLSGCLFLTWCLVNGLIVLETKAYNWQKSQISAKEMQVRQLQADIAQRLSELAKVPLKPSTPPILLIVDKPKNKPTLVGRR